MLNSVDRSSPKSWPALKGLPASFTPSAFSPKRSHDGPGECGTGRASQPTQGTAITPQVHSLGGNLRNSDHRFPSLPVLSLGYKHPTPSNPRLYWWQAS